jgi:SPP1 gp7 family putative phage head morphogenesis protein
MTSLKYWKRREEETLKHYITDEDEYKKHIDGIYDYLLDQIEKEINDFYTKYANKEGIKMAEAKRRVSKLDIEAYERKAKKYVKNKDFSSQANAEMRFYNATMKINRLEMLKANIGLEMVDSFDELQKYFDDILTQRTLDEFERQAGILGESIKDNAKAAHSIVNASFNNATFSDRIWMYQDMLKSELSSLLAEGLIQGRHPNVLARHLQKRFGVQKSYAERLMRTELARVQIEAQKKSYESGGYEQYVFITTHDARACPVCRVLDGHIFKLKDMQIADNAPPMHPNCRCSTAAYEDSEEYKAWLDYLDSGGSTEDWQIFKNAHIKEKSLRTKSGGKYGVKWSKIKSKEYNNRLSALSNNEQANSLAVKRCRNALTNRNGKNTEEIYAISLTSGKDISKITDQHIPFGVKRTDKFMSDIQRAEKNGEKVLFIHNHPGGSPPSIADINELLSHNNAVGITAGHNGSIYYYTKPMRKITNFDFAVAMRKASRYNIDERSEMAIKELSKQFGFEFKKL